MSAGPRVRTGKGPAGGSPPRKVKVGKSNGHVRAVLARDGLSYKRTFLHLVTAVLVSLGLINMSMEFLVCLSISVAIPMWIGEQFKGSSGLVDSFGRFMAKHAGGREYEHYVVNGITWYVTGLVATAFVGLYAGRPGPCVVGVMTLGFGDPAAAWIGKRFGRIRVANGKSVEGFLAFIVAAVLATGAFALASPGPPLSLTFPAILAGAVVGAMAEMACPGDSVYVNDNLVIPALSAAAAAYFAV